MCPVHGAGYPARERAGRTINPKLASVTTGEHAKPGTLAMLLDAHPELSPLYRQYLADPHLLDLRPQVAAAKTLLDHYLRTANLDATIGPAGSEPAVLRAVAALHRVARIAATAAEIENKLGVITHDHMNRALDVVATCFARFVPREAQPEARAFLREGLADILLRGAQHQS